MNVAVDWSDVRATRHAQAGQGPVVVLVHGLGLNHRMWQWQVPDLAARYRVVSYDLLGHGESARPPGPYTMADFTDQLAGLTTALGLSRFALIGFSLGGLIAQAYALAHPGQVAALGVLHSAFDRTPAERESIRERVRTARTAGPSATVEAALRRWFTAAFATEHPEVLEQVRRWVLANDPSAFAAAYDVLAEADGPLASQVARIQCPTVVLTGSEDHGNSPTMADRLAATVAHGECQVLPGLRHMALAERPELVTDALLGFLKRVYPA